MTNETFRNLCKSYHYFEKVEDYCARQSIRQFVPSGNKKPYAFEILRDKVSTQKDFVDTFFSKAKYQVGERNTEILKDYLVNQMSVKDLRIKYSRNNLTSSQLNEWIHKCLEVMN